MDKVSNYLNDLEKLKDEYSKCINDFKKNNLKCSNLEDVEEKKRFKKDLKALVDVSNKIKSYQNLINLCQ
jgi:hypothetical protein